MLDLDKESIKDSTDKKLLDFQYNILKKNVQENMDTVPENNIQNRLLYGGVGASAGLIPSFLAHKLSRGKIKKIELASFPLIMGATGYASIPIMNQIKKEELEKNSSIPFFLKGTLKGGGKLLKTFGKESWKGLKSPMPWKKGMSLGDRALSFGTKGAVGYGAYKGLSSSFKRSKPYDYHTHLRNNIMSGNINMSSLPKRDVSKVMERDFQ
jgi:hypothetical protein